VGNGGSQQIGPPPVYPSIPRLASERHKGYRVGKGALLRAVPTGPVPLVGTLRFAHPYGASIRPERALEGRDKNGKR
jgi:hypothetical protein